MKTTAPLLLITMTISGTCLAEDVGLIEAARQLLSERIHTLSPAHAAKSSSESEHLSKAMITREWNQHAAASYPTEPVVAHPSAVVSASKLDAKRGNAPSPKAQRSRH